MQIWGYLWIKLTGCECFRLLFLTRPSPLSVCLPPTVWRIRYVSSERGTTIKTNYWIDVRQAVVSLPCFFCLCPASALLHIISLSFVFHSVCFSATLRRKIKRFLLWHCIKSLTCQYTVRFEQVVPHCWPLLNHWPSTFHCSYVLSFFFFFFFTTDGFWEH